jgi:putative methyltransferase (TIGR04325 family)
MSAKTQQQSIWQGVFERFEDVPAPEPVFNAEIWVEKQRARVSEMLHSYRSEAAFSRDYSLPTMVAMMMAKNMPIRIVDFGGGMGQSYFDLLAKIPDAEKLLSYVVVETKAVTENIPPELAEFSSLRFVDDFQAIEGKADVVHIGSTLQYIDDWQDLLTNMAEKFCPELFILSDLLVGDIPSFVTAQAYYGHTIPARFINTEEFLRFWEKTTYQLIYRANFAPMGNNDYFPNHELPETHRLKKPCHMVFSLVRDQ